MIGTSFDMVLLIKTIFKRIKVMFEDFDELYERYFGKKNKFEENDEMKKMKNLVDKLNFEDITGEESSEDELGEPNECVTFEENGYTFEKCIWNLEHGTVVKVQMISSPMDTGFINKPTKKTLDERLAIAIEEERYEDAAKLRDEINARKEI